MTADPYLAVDFGTTSAKSLVDVETGALTRGRHHPAIPPGRFEVPLGAAASPA